MPVNEETGERWEYNEPPMLLIGLSRYYSERTGQRRYPGHRHENNPWLDNAVRALEDGMPEDAFE